MNPSPARVTIVTEHWGEPSSEPATVTRLLAGALARSARVDVAHLAAGATSPSTRRDSVFHVHELPLRGARPLRAALLRTALSTPAGGGADRMRARIPEDLEALLEAEGGHAGGLSELLSSLSPDAVVLCGAEQHADLSALEGRGTRPRVVFLPILDGLDKARSAAVGRLVGRADKVLSVHPGEHEALLAAYPARGGDIVPLEAALPVNRSATDQLLFGVHWFGTYVLLIRAFPPATPRYERSVTRELLTSLLGVSVAEVDGDRFTISDGENTVELPVNPTRVNLWRLMAHAEATIDARPPGPFGQEAIESLLLGTPVVVPAGSAAHAIARASGGGFGYEDLGGLLDAGRALLKEGASHRFGVAGRSWAEATHGDMSRFVARASELVLGGGARGRLQPAASSSATSPSRMSDSE